MPTQTKRQRCARSCAPLRNFLRTRLHTPNDVACRALPLPFSTNSCATSCALRQTRTRPLFTSNAAQRTKVRRKNAAKKKPRTVGALSIQSGLSFSQLLLILLVILTGQRLLLLVVQQFARRLEELLLFFLQVVMNLL